MVLVASTIALALAAAAAPPDCAALLSVEEVEKSCGKAVKSSVGPNERAPGRGAPDCYRTFSTGSAKLVLIVAREPRSIFDQRHEWLSRKPDFKALPDIGDAARRYTLTAGKAFLRELELVSGPWKVVLATPKDPDEGTADHLCTFDELAALAKTVAGRVARQGK